MSVSSIESIMFGCTSIDGSVYLELHNELTQMEITKLYDVFRRVRVVHGYVRVSYSISLRSLQFFANLREIRGYDEKG
jgi:hypothetical protein